MLETAYLCVSMQVPCEDRKQLFEPVSEVVDTTEAETTPMQGIENGSDDIPKTKSTQLRTPTS